MSIANLLAASTPSRHSTQPLRAAPVQRLTEREQDILLMISLGLTNKLIARRMNVSVRTVEDLRRELRRKLGTGTLDRLDAMLTVLLANDSRRIASLLGTDIEAIESHRSALRQRLN